MGWFKSLFGSAERQSMSGTCDLCNNSCTGKVVKAKEMASAARRGFCPRAARQMLAAVGLGPEGWQQDAIGGRSSHSDWLVCDTCMREVKSYL